MEAHMVSDACESFEWDEWDNVVMLRIVVFKIMCEGC